MTKTELFHNNNIELFMPDGIEYIFNILENTGSNEYTSKDAKKNGLDTIQSLFELNLIEVFHWGEHHKIIHNLDLSYKQTLNYVDNIWFVGADVPDFYGMVMFKFKDWYLRALENNGLTHTTNWKTFVKEKIGDLEKWIEKNRPKESFDS